MIQIEKIPFCNSGEQPIAINARENEQWAMRSINCSHESGGGVCLYYIRFMKLHKKWTFFSQSIQGEELLSS